MRGAEDQSFDPRTWGADRPASDPPATAPTPRRKSAAARWWPQAAAAAILIGTAIAASLNPGPMRKDRVEPAAPSESGAAGPAASETVLTSRTLKLPGISGLERALLDSGLTPDQAGAVAASALSVLGTRSGEVRAVMRLEMGTAQPSLERLEVSFQDSSGAIVSKGADGSYTAAPVAASLDTVVTRLAGEIDAESFYSSAVAAGVPDTLVSDIAKAFVYDFDFQREIHPGDTFEVVFEQKRNSAGEPVGTAKLLFASLTTDEKSRSLYWYQPVGEDGGWFDGNGASIIRSLMRTPVDGARVSSQFGFRIHPVLGYKKLHKGTDFAAPTGTPIFASGNAVVEFAAFKGANGNLTVLRHDNGWRTLYLHQSRFSVGIEPGARVTQGQQIGEVGTTGRSTGPHLHYEVHIDGEAVNPLEIETDSGNTLAGDQRAGFIRERDRIDVARAARSDI